jgi:2-methylcitrate dehydratase PrpD
MALANETTPEAAPFAPPPATAGFADFTHDLAFGDIPADVVEIAREQAVATIGSCLAGVNMPGAKAMARGLGILGSGSEAALFGLRGRVPAPTAALFNAAMGQIIEWDDWVLISHTGAAVVPTAFAAGEHAKASGREVLAAIVIGNEVAGRTSRAIQRGAYVGNGLPNHQVETPLVAGRVLGLDARALRRSIGLSAYMAMENCFLGWTSDAKLLINGLPAMWGIVSAAFAKEGMVANEDMVEHPAGYLSTVSEEVDYDELLKGLGSEWQTRTLNTKRWPACAYNLSPIECAIALHHGTPNFDPARIRRIRIFCPGVTTYVGTRYQAMQPDVYEMIRQDRMSHMPLAFDCGYDVMAALVDGELTWRQYTKDRIFAEQIQRLRPLVEFVTEAEMQSAYYRDYQYGARVELTLDSGEVVSEARSQLLGARDRPFDHAEKFLEGARGVLDDGRAREALAMLRDLANVEDVSTITHLLQPHKG